MSYILIYKFKNILKSYIEKSKYNNIIIYKVMIFFKIKLST